jgi:hypothetical protein
MTVEGCSPRLSSIKVSKVASKERHLASRVRVSNVVEFLKVRKIQKQNVKPSILPKKRIEEIGFCPGALVIHSKVL